MIIFLIFLIFLLLLFLFFFSYEHKDLKKWKAYLKAIAPEYVGKLFHSKKNYSKNKNEIYVNLDLSEKEIKEILIHELAHCFSLEVEMHGKEFMYQYYKLKKRLKMFP